MTVWKVSPQQRWPARSWGDCGIQASSYPDGGPQSQNPRLLIATRKNLSSLEAQHPPNGTPGRPHARGFGVSSLGDVPQNPQSWVSPGQASPREQFTAEVGAGAQMPNP